MASARSSVSVRTCRGRAVGIPRVYHLIGWVQHRPFLDSEGPFARESSPSVRTPAESFYVLWRDVGANKRLGRCPDGIQHPSFRVVQLFPQWLERFTPVILEKSTCASAFHRQTPRCRC